MLASSAVGSAKDGSVRQNASSKMFSMKRLFSRHEQRIGVPKQMAVSHSVLELHSGVAGSRKCQVTQAKNCVSMSSERKQVYDTENR